jgi:hypothetical protein
MKHFRWLCNLCTLSGMCVLNWRRCVRTGDYGGEFCLSCELLHMSQCHCRVAETHRHKARRLSRVSIRSAIRDLLSDAETLSIYSLAIMFQHSATKHQVLPVYIWYLMLTGRQFMFDVILRCFRLTIAAVGKQCIAYSECVL